MSWNSWLIFFGMVFLITAIPGPNMLHVLTTATRRGVIKSIPTMLGCLSSVIVVLAASAAGLGATLMAFPIFFRVLRVCGAIYLIGLGILTWRKTSTKEAHQQQHDTIMPNFPFLQWKNGVLVGLSNPKLLIFATAFFPQFIVQNAPHIPQFIILIATFSICEIFWYSVYAFGGRAFMHQLARPFIRHVFDRVTGVIFIFFGLFLLREHN
ncbi:LysE family translocator [Zymomonas mobilis]|uniref:LysE family translocator n=1 Tax=Zymomonas mobilis TaxID=542 RepID=UPI0039EAB867